MGQVIYWELCKKFKFESTNKWYMHNPESVLENETHKVLCDFEIKTDHLISARRLDIVLVNNNNKIENLANGGLWRSGRPQIQIKGREKKDKYLYLAWELKKLWNMKVTVIPIVIGALGTVSKGLVKGLEDLEIWEQRETIKTAALLIGHNIEKSPRDSGVTYCHLDSVEKPPINAGVKNSQKSNIRTITEVTELPNQEKNQNARCKERLQDLVNIENRHHQTSRNKTNKQTSKIKQKPTKIKRSIFVLEEQTHRETQANTYKKSQNLDRGLNLWGMICHQNSLVQYWLSQNRCNQIIWQWDKCNGGHLEHVL